MGSVPHSNGEDWGCAGCGPVLDIKRWYVGVITPDFETVEAKMRCMSFYDIDVSVLQGAGCPVSPISPDTPRLREATRMMRSEMLALNPEGYVQMTEGRPGLIARCFKPLAPSSVRSCSLALASTSLGSGALALPYAFALTGVGLGTCTLIFAAMVSALSLQVLMIAARYTNTKSYAAVLELSVGSEWASLALDLVTVINGIGAAICILVFEGDFIPAIFAKPPGMEGIDVSRQMAVVGAALCVWPLTWSSNISALRFVATAVPIVLLLTIAIVLFDAPALHADLRDAGEHIKWWDFKLGNWLKAVAIMVNAFANHMNAIPCVNLLEKPSIQRIVKATVYGNSVVWVLLFSLGFGGYVSWGVVTQGDFLLNYPDSRPEIWMCRIMLTLIVFLVLPISLLPTAKSGAQLFLRVTRSGAHISQKVHLGSATALLLACTMVAMNVSDVASVIGFLGGITASSLMFWFPAVVFRFLLWPTQPSMCRWPVFGSIVVLGTLSWTSVLLPMVVTFDI